MVAAYKLLESLFLLHTRWFYCLKSTITGAEIVDAGPPASTKIRVNPQVSFTPEVQGPIINLAR